MEEITPLVKEQMYDIALDISASGTAPLINSGLHYRDLQHGTCIVAYVSTRALWGVFPRHQSQVYAPLRGHELTVYTLLL
jgi:hypothetical protein